MDPFNDALNAYRDYSAYYRLYLWVYWRGIQTIQAQQAMLFLEFAKHLWVVVGRKVFMRYVKNRAQTRTRRTTVRRHRRRWAILTRPLKQDGTFQMKFRMSSESFDKLYGMLRGRITKSLRLRGKTRNGDIPPRLALAATLRWLAGGSVHEVMELEGVARSTAYNTMIDVLDAITECRALAVRWPRNGGERRDLARRFRHKSAFRVVKHCIGAVDGIVIRIRKPSTKEHLCPDCFFSGHKKVVGLNMQVRKCNYCRGMQGTQ